MTDGLARRRSILERLFADFLDGPYFALIKDTIQGLLAFLAFIALSLFAAAIVEAVRHIANYIGGWESFVSLCHYLELTFFFAGFGGFIVIQAGVLYRFILWIFFDKRPESPKPMDVPVLF